jgi:hypothetical protein
MERASFTRFTHQPLQGIVDQANLPAVLDILLNLDLCFLKKVGWDIRCEDVPTEGAPGKEILILLGP